MRGNCSCAESFPDRTDQRRGEIEYVINLPIL